jgi:hypothetical protein
LSAIAIAVQWVSPPDVVAPDNASLSIIQLH